MRGVLLAALAAVGLSLAPAETGWAQAVQTVQAAGSSPVTVVEHYYHALRGGQWGRAAAYVAPEALDSLKERLWRESQEDERYRLPALRPALESPAEYRRLPPTDVFRYLLSSIDAALPEWTAGIEAVEISNLKVGDDGEARVKVRIERRDERGLLSRQSVTVRARRSHDGWRLLIPGDLPDLVARAGEGN